MTPAPSIDQQLKAMASSWPTFRSSQVNRAGQSAKWIGELAPQFTVYKVEIVLQNRYPRTRILSPTLLTRQDNSEGLLPHVYGDFRDQRLCLFDPDADDWDRSMLVADKIVPWTIDWLTCYEFWLLTGRWDGGGRHPDPLEPTEVSH